MFGPVPILRALALGLLGLVGCTRIADVEVDYTDQVLDICTDFCGMNLSCHEPAVFETHEACEAQCFDMGYILNDSECGEAHRDLYECVGATSTCDAYIDTNNVNADNYTCKAEKMALLALDCGGEDPYP